MALNLLPQTPLQPVKATGLTSGLANLWRKESQQWRQTWFWQLLIWVFLLDGLTILAAESSHLPSSPSDGSVLSSSSVIIMVFAFFTLFPAFGTLIMAHGKLLDEQQSGAGAWILSKPVTRFAVMLSKLASLPGMLLTMTIIPGAIAYLLIWLLKVQMPYPQTFVLILLLNASAIVFFYCLALLLGACLKKRAAILGLGLFICFIVFQVLFQNNLLASMILNQALLSLLVSGALLVSALICFLLACLRFTRQEF